MLGERCFITHRAGIAIASSLGHGASTWIPLPTQLPFFPSMNYGCFFRGNVVTSVFAFQSYLGLTTGSFPITSGTILEEPLYLEKGHFATLLASPFVAVPLWIFHGIVEGT